MAVETTIAAAPQTSSRPSAGGSTPVATRMTISSDSATPSPPSARLPKMPVASIRVSTTIVPAIQPITARRAARSSRAEKNFWYMFASPSSRNIVGRNRANAACAPMSPNSDTWCGSSAASATGRPPASPIRNATPSVTATVITMPLATSR